jgi:hypothetical protein
VEFPKGYIPPFPNTTMRKHIPKRGAIAIIRNRCWACDKGGSVGIYRLVETIKDSTRPVHFREKCIEGAKEKYKAYAAGKMTATAQKANKLI